MERAEAINELEHKLEEIIDRAVDATAKVILSERSLTAAQIQYCWIEATSRLLLTTTVDMQSKMLRECVLTQERETNVKHEGQSANRSS